MQANHKANRRIFLTSTMGTCLAAAACTTTSTSGNQKTRLVDTPQVKRDLARDGRSMRVVFVPHCALNMNARHVDCADFPAMMEPLFEFLRENRIGVIQMPCPELRVLGLGRDRDVPPLNTIREALEIPDAEERLQPLVDDMIYLIKEYQYQDVEIVGILGKNGSPSCGVETTHKEGKQVPGEGILIRELRKKLAREGLDIGLKGIDDHRQEEAIAWVRERLTKT